MNCKNMIVAAYNSGAAVLNQYLNPVSQSFHSLNNDKTHQLIVSNQTEFVKQILSNPKNVGICLGGTGVQQCVQLNKNIAIRAAVVNTKYLAQMCRKHNDANVIIIPTDCIGQKLAGSLTKDFLLSGFDNEQRNMLRINKMKDFDHKYQNVRENQHKQGSKQEKKNA